MKVRLEEGAKAPNRAYPTDAGLDLFAYDEGYVNAHSYRTFRTGVHVELPENTCGLLVSKSGLYSKHGITSTGLIDESYSGEIMVTLHNCSFREYKVEKGDKISQLVVIPCRYEGVEIVDYLEEKGRGNNGFGSTGKQ